MARIITFLLLAPAILLAVLPHRGAAVTKRLQGAARRHREEARAAVTAVPLEKDGGGAVHSNGTTPNSAPPRAKWHHALDLLLHDFLEVVDESAAARMGAAPPVVGAPPFGSSVAFGAMEPLEAWMPKCLEHVQQLLGQLDGAYTDEQLEAALVYECELSREFPTQKATKQFGSHAICVDFAKELARLRMEEVEAHAVEAAASAPAPAAAAAPDSSVKKAEAPAAAALIQVSAIAAPAPAAASSPAPGPAAPESAHYELFCQEFYLEALKTEVMGPVVGGWDKPGALKAPAQPAPPEKKAPAAKSHAFFAAPSATIPTLFALVLSTVLTSNY